MKLYHFSFDIMDGGGDHYFVLAESLGEAEEMLTANKIEQSNWTASRFTYTGGHESGSAEQVKKMTVRIYSHPMLIKCFGTGDPQYGGGIKLIAS